MKECEQGLIIGLLAAAVASKISNSYSKLCGNNKQKHKETCTKNRQKRRNKNKKK